MANNRGDAKPMADATARNLEQLLAAKEIVISCGSGGVGKTTTAAAAGGDGRDPPRRQGAGAHGRPGPTSRQRTGPRAVRQHRDPGPARGVHRRRRRASRRAVGGDARHEAVAGTTSCAATLPTAAPATPSSPTRSTRTSPAGSSRATTTSPWSGCTRSTRRARYDLIVVDTPPDAATPSTSSTRPTAWPTSSAAGCCAGSPRPSKSRVMTMASQALLHGGRPHPRLAVPRGHRRVLHPVPDDGTGLRRAGRGRHAHAGGPAHDVRGREHARVGARCTRPSSSSTALRRAQAPPRRARPEQGAPGLSAAHRHDSGWPATLCETDADASPRSWPSFDDEDAVGRVLREVGESFLNYQVVAEARVRAAGRAGPGP